MNIQQLPEGVDGKSVGFALDAVAIAIETMTSARQSYFSDMDREFMREFAALLRRFAFEYAVQGVEREK